MDDAMIASLKETRFVRLHAELGADAMLAGGGKLKVEVLAELRETEDQARAVAQVTIKIAGIPQQAKESDEPAFRVEVVGQGLYEWPDGGGPLEPAQGILIRQLCQPIYVLMVSEAIRLAQGLGIHDVKIPWDMPVEGMNALPAKKPRARKPAAKAGTSRRAKAA